MKYFVLKDEKIVANTIAGEIEEVIRKKENALICLCAGHSPVAVMKQLVDDAKQDSYPIERFCFVSLDEWIGLGKDDAGSCIYDVGEYFLQPLSIEKGERMFFFDGLSVDLQQQCTQAKEFIDSHGGIDVILLGIGMNGHIGFNEPGATKDCDARVLPLSETSKTVGVKYFNRDYELDYGITIGLKQILGAKKILVMATGAHKADVVKRTLECGETEDFPVSLIKDHADITFYFDEAAGEKI